MLHNLKEGLMKILKKPSNRLHLKPLGGELKNWIAEGCLIGLGIGVIFTIILSFVVFLNFNLPIVRPTILNTAPAGVVFLTIFILCLFFFGTAGALIGIGVPKFKKFPDQGTIKKWKTVVSNLGNKKSSFIPDEKRT